MKKIKFREFLAKEILAGRKTSTWRLFDDKDLDAGDRVEFLVWETGEKFADAEIIKMEEKRLGEVEEKDFEKHEKYESPEKMLEEYRKYYGDVVTLDTLVKILDFKLL
ncbi:MAG: ASCH domain-containing protein [Candidatus Uhrbacteria bacterium]|nr:ASCH domain-containing protein [Candidatus Uhrbacteria bacterium]